MIGTMKYAVLTALIVALSGCTPTFPENPTPDELTEMHGIMNECLDGIIPLEKRYSRKCKAVEKALVAYYGGVDAFLKAHRGYY